MWLGHATKLCSTSVAKQSQDWWASEFVCPALYHSGVGISVLCRHWMRWDFGRSSLAKQWLKNRRIILFASSGVKKWTRTASPKDSQHLRTIRWWVFYCWAVCWLLVQVQSTSWASRELELRRYQNSHKENPCAIHTVLISFKHLESTSVVMNPQRYLIEPKMNSERKRMHSIIQCH